MSITDADIGQNVQRARFLRGLTQAELAQLVGLDRTAVSRIEAGVRSLAATELARVTVALAIPAEDLLRPSSVPRSAPNLTRMLLRAGLVTSNDEPQLAWFVDLVERASAAAPSASVPAPNRRLRALPVEAAGELGARHARRAMCLGRTDPVGSASGLLYRQGVVVVTARFPSASRISGCALTMPNGVAGVLVNANHPLARQRFTVAHELAHLMFDGDNPVSACSTGEIRPGPRSRIELRADVFAGAFLLPKRALVPLRALPIDPEQLYALEAKHGVSHAAAIHRLRELRVLGEDEARALRKAAGRSPSVREVPPFRLAGETLAHLVADDGARRNGDQHGYEVVPDSAVVP